MERLKANSAAAGADAGFEQGRLTTEMYRRTAELKVSGSLFRSYLHTLRGSIMEPLSPHRVIRTSAVTPQRGGMLAMMGLVHPRSSSN